MAISGGSSLKADTKNKQNDFDRELEDNEKLDLIFFELQKITKFLQIITGEEDVN